MLDKVVAVALAIVGVAMATTILDHGSQAAQVAKGTADGFAEALRAAEGH